MAYIGIVTATVSLPPLVSRSRSKTICRGAKIEPLTIAEMEESMDRAKQPQFRPQPERQRKPKPVSKPMYNEPGTVSTNLVDYDTWNPVNGNGPVPKIPVDYVPPLHTEAPRFQPDKVTTKGNYLGSRKTRESSKLLDEVALAILDWDAVRHNWKSWYRETEWERTGMIRLGHIRDSGLYTFEDALNYYMFETLDEPGDMLHPAIKRLGNDRLAAIRRATRRPAELEHSASQDSIATTSTMPLLTPESDVDAIFFPAAVDSKDAALVESSEEMAE